MISTKAEALGKVKKSGAFASQKAHVLQTIIEYGGQGLSRAELATLTGYRLSSICAVVHDLINKEQVISVIGFGVDSSSGCRVELVGRSKNEQAT